MAVSDLCGVKWQCLTCVVYNGSVLPVWCTMAVSDLCGVQRQSLTCVVYNGGVSDMVSVQWRCLT